MYGNQIDFDLGDEFILEEFGRATEDGLVVGGRTYSAVVVPPAMENLNASTLELLRACLGKGLPVYALTVPERVDGRPSPLPAELARTVGWRRMEGVGELVAKLREAVPPHLSGPDGRAIPGGLVWRRAVCAEGTVWFFCNPWAEPFDAEVRVAGVSAVRLDTATGGIEALAAETDADGIRLHLSLPSHGHELLLVTDAPASAPRRAAPRRTPVGLTPRGIRRARPNLLYLDYGDLEAYGRTRPDINTAVADNLNWQWQGFDGNPWDKQFDRTLVERPEEEGTGFSFTYRFTVGADVSTATRHSLRVCIERPWLYHLELNGVEIEQEGGRRWFDEDMRSFDVGRLTQPGENSLVITAAPFHMLCCIMPVYVTGEFSLVPQDRGFAIADPKSPTTGDWTVQGMPFYPDRVRYEFAFSLPRQADGLTARIPEWEGSVAVVHLDGREVGPVMHPPYERDIPGPVASGNHVLAVDILGNMRNMMGSHHIHQLPLRWTFEYAPEYMPPGKAYLFDPTGLLGAPELFALTS